jgi:glycosyl transferase, family 25
MNDLQLFFETLNNFFDKIYVITLKRATERHEHVRKELNGLRYELFYGVDKQEFDIEDLKKQGIYNEELAIRHHRYTKPLVPGMIGCSWSHRNVYGNIIENGFKNALILEDDVVVDKEMISALPEVLQQLPKDWELVYFGYARHEQPQTLALKKATYFIQRFFGKHKFSYRTIKNLYPRKISENIFEAGYHDQTHAYAVSLSGAQKLKKLQEPITYIADNLLAHAATNNIVKAYIVQPKFFHQLSQGEIKMASTYIDG